MSSLLYGACDQANVRVSTLAEKPERKERERDPNTQRTQHCATLTFMINARAFYDPSRREEGEVVDGGRVKKTQGRSSSPFLTSSRERERTLLLLSSFFYPWAAEIPY